MTTRWSAHDVIDRVADGDVELWDDDLASGDPLSFVDSRSYEQRLREATAAAATSEAVVTGTARIAGRDIVLIVGAFEFLAGTQGIVVGERVARAFDRATTRRLPVIGMPVSGGTRMQEGTPAFLQMLKIAASVGAYRRGGGRYLAWLRHPTTGGSLASWGSLAQVTWAQPGALIGLTGPRVIEQLEGAALPHYVQRAEHLATHGVVDEVVAAAQLPSRLPQTLEALGPVPRGHGGQGSPAPGDGTAASRVGAPAEIDAWTSVRISRRGDRPGLPALLDRATDIVHLSGDAAGGVDRGGTSVICRLRGSRVVLVGHDRRPGQRGASLGAVGYRAARRAMAGAAELGLPLVTVVDTRGAAATVAAESGGAAREIARCMMTMAGIPVPTVAVLLGEGSGGGAIAWLAADRVIAAEHAWLAPIAPEGASAILYRTTDRAADVARRQAIDVASLSRLGLVDRVIDERGSWVDSLVDAIETELHGLRGLDGDARRAARRDRLRSLGNPPD